MSYQLGSSSLKELQGVHPRIVAVVKRAIELTTQDFGVHDGLRTIEEQRRYVASGVSKTMNSMHMCQADGYGHAVDLVPYINCKLRWEWPAIYPIAVAVRKACGELNTPLRWGGCWGPILAIADNEKAMQQAVSAYSAARRKMGKSAFLDGPHFELAV